MSDKVDLAEIDDEASYHDSDEAMPVIAGDVRALVRAVRAAMALMQPTPEQLRDPMFLHRAGEGLRSELEAFTDSAKENSDA